MKRDFDLSYTLVPLCSNAEHIQVALRVRPLMSSGVNDIADESCVTILDQRSVQIREKNFTFDHVFGDEATQVRAAILG